MDAVPALITIAPFGVGTVECLLQRLNVLVLLARLCVALEKLCVQVVEVGTIGDKVRHVGGYAGGRWRREERRVRGGESLLRC